MSLRALVETTIHLESFRNIELFYQGLYYLKLRLYADGGSNLFPLDQNELKNRELVAKTELSKKKSDQPEDLNNNKQPKSQSIKPTEEGKSQIIFYFFIGISELELCRNNAHPYCSFVSHIQVLKQAKIK